MSNKAINWAYQQPVKGSRKSALVALANFANEEGICWPSIETLAKAIGCSRSTLIKATKELEAMNLISKKYTSDQFGKRTGILYSLNIEPSTVLPRSVSPGSKLPSSDLAQPSLVLPPTKSQIETQTIIEPLKNPQVKPQVANTARADTLEVFSHWQTVMGHPKAKLDNKRKRKIEQALQDYSIADLKLAIDGCASSKFHRGENVQGRKYDGIGLILRDAEHIEQFIEMANGKSAAYEGVI